MCGEIAATIKPSLLNASFILRCTNVSQCNLSAILANRVLRFPVPHFGHSALLGQLLTE